MKDGFVKVAAASPVIKVADTAYYAANLDVLQDELARQVLPHVEGVESCEVRDGKLVVSIRMSCFIETRAVIIDLFDRDLFEFVQV